MENHIKDFILKSLKYFDNQNNKYKKIIKNTIMNPSSKKFVDKTTNEDVGSDLVFETEILGVFEHQTHIFLWSWSLPYLGINETRISRELLNYGLKLDPQSNTVAHFFLKSLLVNARNQIESDFDLDLILAISSYILKDKYHFIYPFNLYNGKNLKLTSYFLVKISSN